MVTYHDRSMFFAIKHYHQQITTINWFSYLRVETARHTSLPANALAIMVSYHQKGLGPLVPSIPVC